MKTFGKHSKENIIISIIWNLPMIGLIGIPLINMKLDTYLTIGSIAVGFVIMCLTSLRNWYNDYRFEELENLIKSKQNDSNK